MFPFPILIKIFLAFVILLHIPFKSKKYHFNFIFLEQRVEHIEQLVLKHPHMNEPINPEV